MAIDHIEGEDVIITLERNGASTVTNVEGKVTSLNVSGGEENVEVRYAFGNKQILFGKPKEKFKVDMDVIISDQSGLFSQAFFGGSTLAAGTALKSSGSPDNWRITVFFVPSSEQSSSGSTYVPPHNSDDAVVYMFCDCKAVSFERKFDSEDMLGGTISFELSATDPDGYANFFEQYTNSTTSALLEITTGATSTTKAEYRGILTWNTTTPAYTGNYST